MSIDCELEGGEGGERKGGEGKGREGRGREGRGGEGRGGEGKGGEGKGGEGTNTNTLFGLPVVEVSMAALTSKQWIFYGRNRPVALDFFEELSFERTRQKDWNVFFDSAVKL